MPTFRITGGQALFGSVRVGGAKNASYKLMIAALLGNSPSRLLNFSHISDVRLVASLINALGGKAVEVGERCYSIDPSGLETAQISKEHGDVSRASMLFVPVLLARFGRAVVPLPGGDKIGRRPLDRHLDGFQALGATVEERDGFLYAYAPKGLHGAAYRFKKNSHTGTEEMILAAVLAQGTTVLENAAQESEIDDLISLLNNMGARVKRTAAREITIQGVSELSGAIHKIMPDQNQVVSFACAALATRGDLVVENARPDDLTAFLAALDQIGAGYEVGAYGIRFYWKPGMTGSSITTAIHPGFKTDWQPLWVTLMTQCVGESTLHETVYENRFQYTDALRAMGATIELYNPDVSSPDEVYNFNLDDSDEASLFHAARIIGPTPLHGGSFLVKDLRHGATLMVAGMIAAGQTVLLDPSSQVDRGYEYLDRQLNSMGATIVREES